MLENYKKEKFINFAKQAGHVLGLLFTGVVSSFVVFGINDILKNYTHKQVVCIIVLTVVFAYVAMSVYFAFAIKSEIKRQEDEFMENSFNQKPEI